MKIHANKPKAEDPKLYFFYTKNCCGTWINVKTH